MRTQILAGCAVIILGVLGLSGQAPKPATAALITTADAEKAFLTQNCVTCHSEAQKAKGFEPALRLTIDNLDPAHVEKDPETWEKIVRKVRAGMMPPSGMPRPKPEAFESAIVYLENELDRTAKLHIPAPGLH